MQEEFSLLIVTKFQIKIHDLATKFTLQYLVCLNFCYDNEQRKKNTHRHKQERIYWMTYSLVRVHVSFSLCLAQFHWNGMTCADIYLEFLLSGMTSQEWNIHLHQKHDTNEECYFVFLAKDDGSRFFLFSFLVYTYSYFSNHRNVHCTIFKGDNVMQHKRTSSKQFHNSFEKWNFCNDNFFLIKNLFSLIKL